ncbi:MAG: hypothetical protein AB7Q00_02195 [Phycisphaerales bacterium]
MAVWPKRTVKVALGGLWFCPSRGMRMYSTRVVPAGMVSSTKVYLRATSRVQNHQAAEFPNGMGE